MHNQNDKPRLEQSPTSHTFLWSAEPAFAALSPRPTLPKTELAGCLCGAPPARQHARPFPLELGFDKPEVQAECPKFSRGYLDSSGFQRLFVRSAEDSLDPQSRALGFSWTPNCGENE